MKRLETLLALAPCWILITVALSQQVLAARTELTRWKGGGFGMFSTADTLANRSVRAVWVGEDGERRRLQPARAGRAFRVALAYPSPRHLRALGQRLLELERARSADARGVVRLEVWRLELDRERPVFRATKWRQLSVRSDGQEAGGRRGEADAGE